MTITHLVKTLMHINKMKSVKLNSTVNMFHCSYTMEFNMMRIYKLQPHARLQIILTMVLNRVILHVKECVSKLQLYTL